MKTSALQIALATVICIAANGCKRDTGDTKQPPAVSLSSANTGSGAGAGSGATAGGGSDALDAGANCHFIDGSARVVCDDDPEGKHPRVQDCTWEWAEDPCPGAKPGVDQKPPRR